MFQQLYKNCVQTREKRQEDRRLEMLLQQKESRSQSFDLQRILLDSPVKPAKSSGQFKSSKYAAFHEIYGIEMRLQLSEWLREIPTKFDEWVVMPCPQGQRCLVVARGGKTTMYNKAGHYCTSFFSRFPGGCNNVIFNGSLQSYNQNNGFNSKRCDCTILDCIYVSALDSFYVLDILYYGVQSLLDCDAEFRFFWLRSKFSECDGVFGLVDSINNFKPFYLIDKYEMCQEKELTHVLQTYPIWPGNRPSLAGFLFYHKKSTYVCGVTPLVCWLFPFMVPEILHLAVNCVYKLPSNYTNAANYIEYFQTKWAKRKRHWNKKCQRISNESEGLVKIESNLVIEKQEQSLETMVPPCIELEMVDVENTLL